MTSDLLLILYPLGYLSSLLFGLRFFLQWFQSEKVGKSIVNATFWRLSLAGNIALLIHSLIQLQYHVAAIQTINAVISWRNLNLMSSSPKKLSFTLIVMGCLLFSVTSYFLCFAPEWFRIPGDNVSIPNTWHLFGSVGIFLFSSRFLVQWWHAEKNHKSDLSPLFWGMSLTGGLFSLLYFLKLGDTVNVLGPALGLIPYIRNLMMIRKARTA